MLRTIKCYVTKGMEPRADQLHQTLFASKFISLEFTAFGGSQGANPSRAIQVALGFFIHNHAHSARDDSFITYNLYTRVKKNHVELSSFSNETTQHVAETKP